MQPDRPDELKRIEDSGGRVIYWDGARVLGVLAMSRAIGKLKKKTVYMIYSVLIQLTVLLVTWYRICAKNISNLLHLIDVLLY